MPVRSSNRRSRCTLLLVFTCLALGISIGTANAQTNDERSIALGLFEQGRRLRSEGQFASAAEKFEGASRLMRTYGILLNLAECYEKLGRTASAWTTWREAEFVARSQQNKEDEGRAAQRVRELEPRLSYLTITVSEWNRPTDFAITCNGVPVPKAAWSSPLPIDPGAQRIVASAKGYRTWQTELQIRQDVHQQATTVPALDLEPTAAPAVPGQQQGLPVPSATPSDSRQSTTTNPIPAWLGPSIGGVGVLTAVIGVVLWKSGHDNIDTAVAEANRAIAADRRDDYELASEHLSNATGRRTAGVVTTCAGAALAVAGVTLLVIASRPTAAPHASAPRADAWIASHGAGIAYSLAF
jgi:tetratricopeptide (TPR) repeat protein